MTTYLEEGEYLSAENGVVGLPRAYGRLLAAALQLLLSLHVAVLLNRRQLVPRAHLMFQMMFEISDVFKSDATNVKIYGWKSDVSEIAYKCLSIKLLIHSPSRIECKKMLLFIITDLSQAHGASRLERGRPPRRHRRRARWHCKKNIYIDFQKVD